MCTINLTKMKPEVLIITFCDLYHKDQVDEGLSQNTESTMKTKKKCVDTNT